MNTTKFIGCINSIGPSAQTNNEFLSIDLRIRSTIFGPTVGVRIPGVVAQGSSRVEIERDIYFSIGVPFTSSIGHLCFDGPRLTGGSDVEGV